MHLSCKTPNSFYVAGLGDMEGFGLLDLDCRTPVLVSTSCISLLYMMLRDLFSCLCTRVELSQPCFRGALGTNELIEHLVCISLL